MNSEIGKIQEMCDEAEDEESSLQIKLKEFGDTLANIIFIICIVVWVVNYKNFLMKFMALGLMDVFIILKSV